MDELHGSAQILMSLLLNLYAASLLLQLLEWVPHFQSAREPRSLYSLSIRHPLAL